MSDNIAHSVRSRFATLADAQAQLSGTSDWDWGENASWQEWTEYACHHAQEKWDGRYHVQAWTWDHDETLRAYLRSVGADPSDWQL